MIRVVEVTLTDDLDSIVAEINAAEWDEDNAISPYDGDSLRAYLERQDSVFVACHETGGEAPVLMGMASGRIEMKPYQRELWLYVDEVDVCVNQRQKGAGKQIMKFLIDLAERRGCDEVWLGTEFDNEPAIALYRSLDPDDVAEVVGFTWETDE